MKLETFSYLPPLTPQQKVRQIQYILNQGLIPGVEYTRRPEPRDHYWHMWKLPLFSARTPADVIQEVEACKAENPGTYIKLTGYDNKRQCQVISFVVYQPDER
ncbi:MAG: ribulose bisphosphate carboxylase small subunit [Chloroflexi bacterium]|nr:ribulose bisphosphate carboxylase small subunit [Chloroflexota bacterium]